MDEPAASDRGAGGEIAIPNAVRIKVDGGAEELRSGLKTRLGSLKVSSLGPDLSKVKRIRFEGLKSTTICKNGCL